MKRVFAGLLCVCLLLLVGCGQPKEYPPYYPHSDTLRLDASAEEILAATEMEPLTGGRDYRSVAPVSLGDLKCSMTLINCENQAPSVYYLIESTESDLSTEYKAWEKYFSGIYGKSGDVELASSGIAGCLWVFKIDTGEQYAIGLMQYYYANSAPKDYAVMLSINKSTSSETGKK